MVGGMGERVKRNPESVYYQTWTLPTVISTKFFKYPALIISGQVDAGGGSQRVFRLLRFDVDGIRHESQSEVAAAHRITIGSVKSRCRSMSYPGWTCEGVKKVPAKDGKPSFIGIEIDGNRYRSVSAASKSLGLDRSTIMRRLKSQAWPSYKVL